MRGMRLRFHPRGDGIERAEYLGMNMIRGHTPRRQARGQLAQERRRAAQIELAFARNADLVERGNRQMPGCSIAKTGVTPTPALSSTTGSPPERSVKLPRGALTSKSLPGFIRVRR